MEGNAVFLDKLPYNDVLIITDAAAKAAKEPGWAGKPTEELTKFFESMQRQVQSSPVAPEPAVVLTNISANDSGTFGGELPAGLYAIHAYREVTTEDPVSSSLGVTITWTHNGKSLSRPLSTFSGTPQQDTDTATDVSVIETDPNTSIGYVLAYASNTAALARFSLSMIAELLQTIS